MKRFNEALGSQPPKKQKQDHSFNNHFRQELSHQKQGRSFSNHSKQEELPRKRDDQITTAPQPHVPGYRHFTVPNNLPSLPEITNPALAEGPFRHKSVYHGQGSSGHSITYERLEFIGDAYIELIATRMLDVRISNLSVGRLSQLRELLVRNETLGEYSRAYGFDKKVEVSAMSAMLRDTKHAGNKGFNKVLGDVFEAYVAAVITSDPEHGFSIAEKWLTALWAPKLEDAIKYDNTPNHQLLHDPATADPLKLYNPTAKADLQRRVMGSSGIKLSYEKHKDSVELKGDRIGQTRHFIALYLTGYGYDRKFLGKGEGASKVEAGNWAAQDAMFGEFKDVVNECEAKLREIKKQNEMERARQMVEVDEETKRRGETLIEEMGLKDRARRMGK